MNVKIAEIEAKAHAPYRRPEGLLHPVTPDMRSACIRASSTCRATAIPENSVDSEWVEKEVETAFEKERRDKKTILFPIRLDDAVMDTDQARAADIRRTRHIGDFRDWKNHDSYKKAFERLLRDLKAAV